MYHKYVYTQNLTVNQLTVNQKEITHLRWSVGPQNWTPAFHTHNHITYGFKVLTNFWNNLLHMIKTISLTLKKYIFFFTLSNFFAFVMIKVDPEPILGTRPVMLEYTLDVMPVHSTAPFTYIFTYLYPTGAIKCCQYTYCLVFERWWETREPGGIQHSICSVQEVLFVALSHCYKVKDAKQQHCTLHINSISTLSWSGCERSSAYPDKTWCMAGIRPGCNASPS